MRLNLGCGKDVRPGWTNVDTGGGPGVMPWDIRRLPLADGTVDEVLASHVLEHQLAPADVILEVARVLKPGGLFTVIVPYGLRSLYNPFHHHAFDETSMDLFFRTDPRSLEPRPLFSPFAIHITSRGWPFWHVRRYLGVPLAVGRKEEVTYWLVRR